MAPVKIPPSSRDPTSKLILQAINTPPEPAIGTLAMSPTLLSLPLEIRQQIYDLALISPTLHLCAHFPNSRKATSAPTSNLKPRVATKRSRTRIQLLPCDPITSLPISESGAIAVGLVSTNRQIHQETTDIIWGKNTLCFVGTGIAVRVLKEIMGQEASRRVQRLQITLHDTAPSILRKEFERVMGILASRTRKGCLRQLNFRVLAADLSGIVAGPGRRYEHLLETLQKAAETRWAVGTRRTLLLDLTPECLKDSDLDWFGQDCSEELPDWIVREMAWAWGGIVNYHGKVVWENSKQVGYLPLPKE